MKINCNPQLLKILSSTPILLALDFHPICLRASLLISGSCLSTKSSSPHPDSEDFPFAISLAISFLKRAYILHMQ